MMNPLLSFLLPHCWEIMIGKLHGVPVLNETYSEVLFFGVEGNFGPGGLFFYFFTEAHYTGQPGRVPSTDTPFALRRNREEAVEENRHTCGVNGENKSFNIFSFPGSNRPPRGRELWWARRRLWRAWRVLRQWLTQADVRLTGKTACCCVQKEDFVVACI
jgi:hypothetical protein